MHHTRFGICARSLLIVGSLLAFTGTPARAFDATAARQAGFALGAADVAAVRCHIDSTKLRELHAQFEWLRVAPAFTHDQQLRIKEQYDAAAQLMNATLDGSPNDSDPYGCDAQRASFRDGTRLRTIEEMIHRALNGT